MRSSAPQKSARATSNEAPDDFGGLRNKNLCW